MSDHECPDCGSDDLVVLGYGLLVVYYPSDCPPFSQLVTAPTEEGIMDIALEAMLDGSDILNTRAADMIDIVPLELPIHSVEYMINQNAENVAPVINDIGIMDPNQIEGLH